MSRIVTRALKRPNRSFNILVEQEDGTKKKVKIVRRDHADQPQQAKPVPALEPEKPSPKCDDGDIYTSTAPAGEDLEVVHQEIQDPNIAQGMSALSAMFVSIGLCLCTLYQSME